MIPRNKISRNHWVCLNHSGSKEQNKSDKKRFAELAVTADFQLAGDYTHPDNFVEMEPLIGDRAHAQLPIRDISLGKKLTSFRTCK